MFIPVEDDMAHQSQWESILKDPLQGLGKNPVVPERKPKTPLKETYGSHGVMELRRMLKQRGFTRTHLMDKETCLLRLKEGDSVLLELSQS